MNSTEIVNRIAEKGGLLGTCAKMYKDNPILADEFISECYDYCKLPLAEKLWGETLTNEIISFVTLKREQTIISFPGAIELRK